MTQEERIAALERLTELLLQRLEMQSASIESLTTIAENNHKRIERLEKALGRAMV